jgi:hypothetical protein
MYSVEDQFIDDLTLSNISDPRMPLTNNGPTSFWSPGLIRKIYGEQGFSIEKLERIGTTYSNGNFVEYLSISAV